MTEAPERRIRRPKRPVVYLVILAASAALSLGAAWMSAHPSRGFMSHDG